MIKSISFIDESIFNYLGEEDYAVFIGLTGLCDGIKLNDGVAWVQYDENDSITAVVATGQDGKKVIFAEDDADEYELHFLIGGYVITEEDLLPETIDKKYLLRKNVISNVALNGVDKNKYMKIKSLDSEVTTEYQEIVAFKMLLNSMGKCEGVLITENSEDIGGGFITFSQKISLITDVHTSKKYRNQGYGKQVVEKLLKCSPNENVYLISREHNLEFYEKCGFEIVKEIYDYKG